MPNATIEIIEKNTSVADPFKELLKCQESFQYFVKNYVRITTKYSPVSFDLRDEQLRLIQTYENEQYIILQKYRNGGFTTLTVIYMLWRAMFFTEQSIMFLAKTDREAQHIGKICDQVLFNLPESLTPKGNFTLSLKTFSLTNSKIFFRGANLNHARGRSLTHLVVDEAAFIPNMEDLWQAFYPCLGGTGKAIILSTINTIIDWFQTTYVDAERHKNGFQIFETNYKNNPIYQDEAYLAQIRKTLGEVGFHQEILCQFLCEKSIPNPAEMSLAEIISFYEDAAKHGRHSDIHLVVPEAFRRLKNILEAQQPMVSKPSNK